MAVVRLSIGSGGSEEVGVNRLAVVSFWLSFFSKISISLFRLFSISIKFENVNLKVMGDGVIVGSLDRSTVYC